MKYSETPTLTSAELLGTELICVLDRNGSTKTITTATLKSLMPVPQGVGLLLANPRTATGYRLADPTGEVAPPVPVSAPTITYWQSAGTTSMYIQWVDNQVNPSDAFLINVSLGGSPVAGSPFRVTNTGGSVDNYTVAGLSPGTSYTAQMVAEAGGDTSPLSNSATASTQIDSSDLILLYEDDYENKSLGDVISDYPNYSPGAGTVIDNTRAETGSQCLKTTVDPAEGGNTGYFGFWFRLPNNTVINRTDTLRMSMSYWFPSSWQWDASARTKFMRMRTNGTNTGHSDLYVDKNNQMAWINENVRCSSGIPNCATWVFNVLPNPKIPAETWTRIGFEVTFDRIPVDDGGTGEVVTYYNGVENHRITDMPTLEQDSGIGIDQVLVFTYWNGTVPQVQSCWMDNFKIEYKRG